MINEGSSVQVEARTEGCAVQKAEDFNIQLGDDGKTKTLQEKKIYIYFFFTLDSSYVNH